MDALDHNLKQPQQCNASSRKQHESTRHDEKMEDGKDE
jgi:hypothetical protein